jgi:hypothetical protein
MAKAPKAILLLRRKRYYDDGAISEVVLWRVPEAVPGSGHWLKYRLFYGYPGRRAVAYDNERGKGDHRHRNGHQEPYLFMSLDKLLADFEADVAALRAEEGNNG